MLLFLERPSEMRSCFVGFLGPYSKTLKPLWHTRAKQNLWFPVGSYHSNKMESRFSSKKVDFFALRWLSHAWMTENLVLFLASCTHWRSSFLCWGHQMLQIRGSKEIPKPMLTPLRAGPQPYSIYLPADHNKKAPLTFPGARLNPHCAASLWAQSRVFVDWYAFGGSGGDGSRGGAAEMDSRCWLVLD